MSLASFWPSAAGGARRAAGGEVAVHECLEQFMVMFPKSLGRRAAGFLRGRARIRDRRRQRLRAFQQAEQRQDHQEVDEVVGGQDARPEPHSRPRLAWNRDSPAPTQTTANIQKNCLYRWAGKFAERTGEVSSQGRTNRIAIEPNIANDAAEHSLSRNRARRIA